MRGGGICPPGHAAPRSLLRAPARPPRSPRYPCAGGPPQASLPVRSSARPQSSRRSAPRLVFRVRHNMSTSLICYVTHHSARAAGDIIPRGPINHPQISFAFFPFIYAASAWKKKTRADQRAKFCNSAPFGGRGSLRFRAHIKKNRQWRLFRLGALKITDFPQIPLGITFQRPVPDKPNRLVPYNPMGATPLAALAGKKFRGRERQR
ncbi:MAG: hypothetical protein CM15mP84_05820 [Cellvibrionales bacterium]|nr:MAG: hypothetical protein CM15mP84_05820 [Cellvibrionales bacterium]